VLGDLTIDSFRPHGGSVFTLDDAERGPVELTLAEVRSLGEQSGEREPFALLFRGPPGAPVYGQQTVRLQHEQLGELGIFIVPVGNGPDGADYEAIFT
jgi:hypothetical protein